MDMAFPKQYLDLNGAPVLEHVMRKLTATELFKNIVIAAQPNDGRAMAIASLFPNSMLASGGSERVLSVRNALSELSDRAAPDDWVFVHDAARPCVRTQDILKLYQAIQSDSVGGLLAIPMPDTVKQAHEGRATHTVDRTVLWQAQTPQAFRYGLLVQAIQHALDNHLPVTDEASAIEALGHQPILVEGSSDNLKITYAHDLLIAEALCE